MSRRYLLILSVLIFLACPFLTADSITFSSTEETTFTAIPNLDSFELTLQTGDEIFVFLNNTIYTFVDFHFTFDLEQYSNVQGIGGDFFADSVGSKTAVNFKVTVFHGTGIIPMQKFRIDFSGFRAGTVVTCQPTIKTPEPLTVLLGITGILFIGLPGQRRTRHLR